MALRARAFISKESRGLARHDRRLLATYRLAFVADSGFQRRLQLIDQLPPPSGPNSFALPGARFAVGRPEHFPGSALHRNSVPRARVDRPRPVAPTGFRSETAACRFITRGSLVRFLVRFLADHLFSAGFDLALLDRLVGFFPGRLVGLFSQPLTTGFQLRDTTPSSYPRKRRPDDR